MRISHLVWVTVPILLASSCNDEIGPCDLVVHHDFELPVELIDAKLVYNVGDTINLISEFTEMLYERSLDTMFRLVDWDFYPALVMKRMDTVAANGQDEIIYAKDDFEYVIRNANLTDFQFTQNALFGEFERNFDSYLFEIDIIPLRTGVYMISMGSEVGFYDSHQPFEGGCPGVRSEAVMIMNGGADNNIHLLEQSPHPHFNTTILSRPDELFFDRGGYAFVVE